MARSESLFHHGAAQNALPASALSHSARRWRGLSIALWSVMLFAPSILLGFTATQSKFSLASVIAAVYVLWRVLFRPLPALTATTGLGFLLAVYLLIHGILLTAWTGNMNILLLEGQWLVYLVCGILLTLDMVRTSADIAWTAKAMVWLGLAASAMGIVSIWTGPFYSYSSHVEGRWGLLLGRACGPFEAPGMLGAFLMIVFVLWFFTSPAAGSQAARGSLGRQAGLILLMVTLLLTQAKGAIFATLASLALGIPIAAKTAARRRAAMVKLLYVVLFVGAIAYISSAFQIDIKSLLADDADSRGKIGMTILSDFAQDSLAPQLFGIGFRQSATIDPETGLWFTAHNSYISFVREIGLVGCAVLGGLVILCLSGLSERGSPNWAFALISLLLVATTEGYLFASFSVFFLGSAVGIADRLHQFSAAPAAADGLCAEPS